MSASDNDALNLFRTSLAASSPPLPTRSADASSASDIAPLTDASHLLFNTQSAADGAQHTALPLTTATRFVSQTNGALDLASIFWCWQNKDKSTGDYIAATQELNTARTSNGLSEVRNLVFAEKLDLINWLSGENDSEFIRSLDDNRQTRAQAHDAAKMASGDGDVVMQDARAEDDKLRDIYALERKTGDRNSILRGSKPTDFSHVRKYAEAFLGRSKASAPTPALITPAPAIRPAKPSSGRRPEPIILLSPSASSLLRLSNVKSFLMDGVYTPPTSTTSTTLNILHVNRVMPSIEPTRPLRFILVESPDNFKPDYWNRVVAVFTTGQAWQFKGYKWSQPAELFSHALGVYVGWRNELLPDTIKGWGRGVLNVGIDAYRLYESSRLQQRDKIVLRLRSCIFCFVVRSSEVFGSSSAHREGKPGEKASTEGNGNASAISHTDWLFVEQPASDDLRFVHSEELEQLQARLSLLFDSLIKFKAYHHLSKYFTSLTKLPPKLDSRERDGIAEFRIDCFLHFTSNSDAHFSRALRTGSDVHIRSISRIALCKDVSRWTYHSVRSHVESPKKKLKAFYLNFFGWSEEEYREARGHTSDEILKYFDQSKKFPTTGREARSRHTVQTNLVRDWPGLFVNRHGPNAPAWFDAELVSRPPTDTEIYNMKNSKRKTYADEDDDNDHDNDDNNDGNSGNQQNHLIPNHHLRTCASTSAYYWPRLSRGRQQTALPLGKPAIPESKAWSLHLERDRFALVDNLFENGHLVEPRIHELVFGNPMDNKPTFLWFFDDTSDDEPRSIRNRPSAETAITMLRAWAERLGASGIQIFDAPDYDTAALVPVHEVTRRDKFVQRASFELELEDNGDHDDDKEDDEGAKRGFEADSAYKSRDRDLRRENEAIQETPNSEPNEQQYQQQVKMENKTWANGSALNVGLEDSVFCSNAQLDQITTFLPVEFWGVRSIRTGRVFLLAEPSTLVRRLSAAMIPHLLQSPPNSTSVIAVFQRCSYRVENCCS
ncbi:CDC73-domain-containing protein, partial [Aureobasidium melanogenum]